MTDKVAITRAITALSVPRWVALVLSTVFELMGQCASELCVYRARVYSTLRAAGPRDPSPPPCPIYLRGKSDGQPVAGGLTGGAQLLCVRVYDGG